MILGICDDEKEMRTMLDRICRDFFMKYGEPVELQHFSCGDEIEDSILDILILDIDMPGQNGIEVKQKLQFIGAKTLIIFVTSHDEYMPQAFGKNVIGFVRKTCIEEQLHPLLQAAVQIIGKNVIVDGYNSKDILYIQSQQNYCNFFLANDQTYLSRNSIKQLEKDLHGTTLVKIHKSYIVNFSYIDKFSEDQVWIQGKSLPISIRLRTKVGQKYKEYCRENARYC